jgi:hypothetical protein
MAPADRLEELYRRDGKKLWRSLFAFTGDPQVTDDSIAEAFAEALERGSEIQDQSRWVWKVSFLLASREVRRLASLTEIRDTTSFELPEPHGTWWKPSGSFHPNSAWRSCCTTTRTVPRMKSQQSSVHRKRRCTSI